MQTISLQDYSIQIAENFSPISSFFAAKNYSQVIVLVDENTARDCLPFVADFLPDFQVISIPAGEVHKTLETCTFIWKKLMDLGADRKAILVNLGGGVIGDMGGFCASTYKRGMSFLQIPTTLLSQVDASIGGKLGVDFQGVKNSIGVFNNPEAVLIFPKFLETLSSREVRSGFAEVIKHTLIEDVEQWQHLPRPKSPAWGKFSWLENVNWSNYLAPSLHIKKRIVEADPFEKNVRKALNFGHTIGHAIESLALETDAPLTHGEAIAVGMICEAYLSVQKTGLSPTAFEEIAAYIRAIFQPAPLLEKDFQTYVDLMYNDKKNEDGKILCTLLTEIGKFEINVVCSEAEIREALAILR